MCYSKKKSDLLRRKDRFAQKARFKVKSDRKKVKISIINEPI